MDKDFFMEELQAYQVTLYRVAYTVLRDDDACRDALQDAALKAWEKRFSLREPPLFSHLDHPHFDQRLPRHPA